MNRIFRIMLLVFTLFVTTSCTSMRDVHPKRVGCTSIKGEARYGLLLTNFIKGQANGVYIYVGEDIPAGVGITCDMLTQTLSITTGASDE